MLWLEDAADIQDDADREALRVGRALVRFIERTKTGIKNLAPDLLSIDDLGPGRPVASPGNDTSHGSC